VGKWTWGISDREDGGKRVGKGAGAGRGGHKGLKKGEGGGGWDTVEAGEHLLLKIILDRLISHAVYH
jgi:hypothetical protein